MKICSFDEVNLITKKKIKKEIKAKKCRSRKKVHVY